MEETEQANDALSIITNQNEIEKLVSNDFSLDTIEQLLSLQAYIQNNTESVEKLSENERNKRILLKTEYTCSVNDLMLIELSRNTKPAIKSLICKDTSIKYSFVPCSTVLKELINILPEIKDQRFVQLYLNTYGDYNDLEKEKICKYLQQFIEVPTIYFPNDTKNIEVNKNTLNHFLLTNEFPILFSYHELIYEEIIIAAISKTNNLTQLKALVQISTEFSLNLIAVKILLKQLLSIDHVTRLFDVVCSKCLKNVLIDFHDVNYIEDHRFFVFDLSPQIIYNSFNILKTKTYHKSFRGNCLFFKYCSNLVDTQKFFELQSLALSELLAISFSKRKTLSTTDIQLINEVEDAYSFDLLNQFVTKHNKEFQNTKICKYENYLFSYEKLVITKRQIGKAVFETEDYKNYFKELELLKSNERKDLLEKIGAMNLKHILPANEISGYYLFLEFILENIFFKELEIKTFLKFTDLNLLTRLELPHPFLNKFLKTVLLNVNTYNEEVVLKILHNELNRLHVSRIISSLQPLLLNTLLFIKKILNGDFLTVASLHFIQQICLVILDFLEIIEDSNKMEMLLELIYEKVKLKSKYLKMKVKLKTVKK